MDFDAIKCPGCGADLKAEEYKDSAYCPYCRVQVSKDENQNTVISGDAAAEGPLLQKAFMHLEKGEFSDADFCFDLALDVNNECSKAYIGKLMVMLEVCHMEELAYHDNLLSIYPYFNLALKYADEEEKKYYTGLNQNVRDRISEQQQAFQDVAANSKVKRKRTRMMYLIIAVVTILLVVSIVSCNVWFNK